MRKKIVKTAIKFDPETRERFRSRLGALLRTGMKQVDIADVLRREGFRTPSGDEINAQFVANQKRFNPELLSARPKRADVPTERPTESPEVPSFLADILKDRSLSDTKARRIALAYLD